MEAELREPASVQLARRVRVPDPIRLERCLRAPELGPRILFFTGGNALRKTSRALKRYTHNSIHLVTPFDSGGSSAVLREAFDMLAIGDLRNRLMALADESVSGNPEIYRLFAHRLPADAAEPVLRSELRALLDGTAELIRAVPEPMRRIVRTRLAWFAAEMPPGFDLRGASVGNLVLTGGYLSNGRDIDAVIFTFSRLVKVRGQVRPVVDDRLQLRAHYGDGTYIVGQHRITRGDEPPRARRIEGIDLVRSLDDPSPAPCAIDATTRGLIHDAELICYPMGSFFTSLSAALAPAGVADALVDSGVPKVYVPNTDRDPEQRGYDPTGCVERLVAALLSGAPPGTEPHQVLDVVITDRTTVAGRNIDVARLRELGIAVLDQPLSRPGSGRIDGEKLAQALVSLV